MPTVCWSQFETTTRNNLQYYWSHPQFTDVTLALEEGKEIKAHKIILCNGSTLFQKLFSNSHEKNYFNIDDIHPKITFKELEIIVKFIYLGKCEMETSELESILSLGRDLGIIGLMESQENFVLHFPCDKCNYKATEYESLTKHIENIHTEIKYTCNHCKYKSIDEQDLTNHIQMVHKKVKTGRKNQWGRSKVRSENCLSNMKDPETMTIDEVEEELQTYMDGETDQEKADYYAAARKRARDRLVKTYYRDVKKPGKIDNILIKVDMLKDFRKNGRKPISLKRLRNKNDKTAKVSNKDSSHTQSLKDTILHTDDINVITIDKQEANTITQSVQGEGDSTQYLPKVNECVQNIQEINEINPFVEMLNGETKDNQKGNVINTLQSVNHITTNRLEVSDVNPEIRTQTVDDVVTHTLDINDIDSFLETIYNTSSYNKVNIHEPNDFSSHLQQESNMMSYSQDVNYSMELEDTSVQVEKVNENIPHPHESDYASSILQEAMEESVDEVENTYNAKYQNYHYTFSFEDMEEVSANLLFSSM